MAILVEQDDLTHRELASLLGALLDSALDAVIVIDIDGVVTEWSKAAVHIFGFSREEAVGHTLDKLIIPAETVSAHQAGMDRYRATGKGPILDRRVEMEAVDRDGARFPIEVAISRVAIETGVFFLARVRNITDRVQYERRLRLVSAELDHRVKNSLAVVLAIASRTVKTATSLGAFFETYEARVLAYTRTHDLLLEAQHRGASLRDLYVSAFSPYRHEAVTLDGPDVTLRPAAALTVGMCIHEMTTNAVKHGALSADSGCIAVVWRLTESELVIDWTETGGPNPGIPTRKGFGSQLIKTGLVDDLQGSFRLAFPPTGLTGQVRIPADRLRKPP